MTRVAVSRRALPAYACAAVHLLAPAVMGAVLQRGTEMHDLGDRARHVAAHPLAWRAGWMAWMAAALTLVAFYAWWGRRAEGRRGLAPAAVVLAALGAACDLAGEWMYAFRLPPLAAQAAAGSADALARFAAVQARGTWLTAVAANGLYTLGGVALTVATPSLRGRLALAPWTTWTAGLALSAAGLVGSAMGMAMASAVLFPALVLTCVVVAREVG